MINNIFCCIDHFADRGFLQMQPNNEPKNLQQPWGYNRAVKVRCKILPEKWGYHWMTVHTNNDDANGESLVMCSD